MGDTFSLTLELEAVVNCFYTRNILVQVSHLNVKSDPTHLDHKPKITNQCHNLFLCCLQNVGIHLSISKDCDSFILFLWV